MYIYKYYCLVGTSWSGSTRRGKSKENHQTVIVGNYDTKYGFFLKKRYLKYSNIIFLGGIYDINILNNLRFYCRYYFHGHSVGGTNPSLLEAMAAQSFIVANDNIFNKTVLSNNALYFENTKSLIKIINDYKKQVEYKEKFVINNIERINKIYNWKNINKIYLSLVKQITLDG